MSGWEVRVALRRDERSFALDTVRLLVRQGRSYLMADGTWKTAAEEGTTVDGDMGILLPTEAVEPLAQAIIEFQGHVTHADTEARVLRESLEVERRRVDAVLAAMSLYERIAETQRHAE